MSAQLVGNRMATPPPRVFDLDLFDGDRLVGWLSHDVVGFRGYADEREAMHSSWVAFRTLQRRLAQSTGTRPPPIDHEQLSLKSDDTIHASGRPIATLVRSGDERSGESFGFELRFPHSLDEVAARAKALLIYRTLRRAGVRWSMWRPLAAPVPVLQPTTSAKPVTTVPLSLGPAAIATVVSVALLAASLVAPGAGATALAAAGLAGLMAVRLRSMRPGATPLRVTRD